MAEITDEPGVTQALADSTSPPSGDNDAGTGADAGPPSSSETPSGSASFSQEVLQRLGYRDVDELEQTHTRYKQQVSGSQREVQRLQRERDEALARMQEYERRVAAAQPVQPPQPTQPQGRMNIAQAIEAYLNNDTEALSRYETQQQSYAVDLAKNEVLSTLSTAVKPAQYSELLLQEFPDLNDRNSSLYREIYRRYDEEARHPRYALLYASQDPLAIRDAMSPDGVEQKRVDMRIVYDLARKVAVDLARNEGRTQETRRRAAAGAAGGPGNPPARGNDEAVPLYEDELIDDPRIRAAMAANGKGRDPRTLRKWFQEKMPEAEKAKRRRMQQSGTWTGRRAG